MTRLLPVLLLAATLAGCASDAPELPPPVVRIAIVGQSEAQDLSFVGTTQATSESRVSFQVGGTLVRRSADVGDRVRAGQVLAQLDPSDIALQRQQAASGLAQAEAGLRQARAGARLAQAEYERVRALYADDLIALSGYDGARTGRDTARDAVEQAQAGVSAARDGVALADRALGYTRLVSPSDGSVGDIYAEPGELVAPGQPIALIASDDAPMEIRFDASESVVGEVQAGRRVRVTLTALDGAPFNGTITQVGTAAARGGTTYPVTVRLENADARVRSGMTGRVTLPRQLAADAPAALVVPVSSLDRDERGSYALIVSGGRGAPVDSARVERRSVTTGRLLSGGVEVTSGLAAGDRIVAAGLSDLLPGQAVRVLASDPLRESVARF